MDPVAPAQAQISGGLWATGKLPSLHRVTEDFKELVVASDLSKLVVPPGVPLQTRSEVSLNPWKCNRGLQRQPKLVVKQEVFSQARAYHFSAKSTRLGPHVPSVSVPGIEESLGLMQARAVRFFGCSQHFTCPKALLPSTHGTTRHCCNSP